MKYDLHLHSTASDGDDAPAAVVRAAAERGLKGVSLTDHNGLWGAAQAAQAAQAAGIQFLEGIEVSARWEDMDVHVLGYSRGFKRDVLQAGLAGTRQGYAERVRAMVRLCQAQGYERVTWEVVQQRRADLLHPAYVSYDVARLLTREYGLSVQEARRLTTTGGLCYVPYGAWALTLRAAAELLHAAHGVALLAHPGLVGLDAGEATLTRLLAALPSASLDGLEVFHPYHDEALTARLAETARRQGWLVSGGSDWHGAGRYEKSDAVFGRMGLLAEDFVRLLAWLDGRMTNTISANA